MLLFLCNNIVLIIVAGLGFVSLAVVIVFFLFKPLDPTLDRNPLVLLLLAGGLKRRPKSLQLMVMRVGDEI